MLTDKMEKDVIPNNNIIEGLHKFMSGEDNNSEGWASFYQDSLFSKKDGYLYMHLIGLVIEEQMKGLGASPNMLTEVLMSDIRRVRYMIRNFPGSEGEANYLERYRECPACGTNHYQIPVVCNSNGCQLILRAEDGITDPNRFPKYLVRATDTGIQHIKELYRKMGNLFTYQLSCIKKIEEDIEEEECFGDI